MAGYDPSEGMSLLEKYLALMGSGMVSSKHGIQQLMNSGGIKHASLGTTDADMKEMDFDRRAIAKLSEATPGGMVAEMAGNFADPIGILAGAGVGKVLSLGKTLAQGATRGALSGGIGEAEDSTQRLANMAMGGGASTLMPLAGQAKKIWAGRKAHHDLPTTEKFVDAEIAAYESKNNGGRGYKDPDVIKVGTDKGLEHGYSKPDDTMSNPLRTWIDQSNTDWKPQFAIDVQRAIDKDPIRSFANVNKALGQMIDAPELFKAYPHLKYLPVELTTGAGAGRKGAYYAPTNNTRGKITISAEDLTDRQHLATLIHEIQHSVQNFEGLPGGDSKGRVIGMMRGGTGGEDFATKKAYQAYLANPGEIEARDAAARFFANPSNSQNNPIYSMHGEAPYKGTMFNTIYGTDLPLAKKPTLGILRDDPDTGRLMGSLSDINQAHDFPLFTRDMKAKQFDGKTPDEIEELLKQFRFDKFGNNPR